MVFYPFRFVFEFDVDEGLELMSALLHSRGLELYTQIYRDHPPLFTLLLSGLFRVAGPNVTIARLLVLLTSGALLTAALGLLQGAWGWRHALAGFFMVPFVPYYHQLSVSAMIGLPSIALAVAALAALTTWHRKRRRSWLLASGALLAFSVMTKLFTGLLVPLFGIGILSATPRGADSGRGWRERARAVGIWAAGFLTVFGALILFSVGPGNLTSLFDLAVAGVQAQPYLDRADSVGIFTYLEPSRGILLLAVLGAVVAARSRVRAALYLVGWIALGVAFLIWLVPVWYHHQLLITVPAAMLAAFFIGEVAGTAPRRIRQSGLPPLKRLVDLGAVAVIVLVVVSRIPPMVSQFDLALPNLRGSIDPASREFEIVAVMADHAASTNLVLTDRPMFPFRIEKPVPGSLVVFSEKRLLTGELTEGRVLEVLGEAAPEQVLLARFALPTVEAKLKEDYERVYSYKEYRLYIRRDLAAGSGAEGPAKLEPTAGGSDPAWIGSLTWR